MWKPSSCLHEKNNTEFKYPKYTGIHFSTTTEYDIHSLVVLEIVIATMDLHGSPKPKL
jgi:hypothetical protein